MRSMECHQQLASAQAAALTYQPRRLVLAAVAAGVVRPSVARLEHALAEQAAAVVVVVALLQ